MKKSRAKKGQTKTSIRLVIALIVLVVLILGAGTIVAGFFESLRFRSGERLVLMSVDSPAGANKFRYITGRESFGKMYQVERSIGHEHEGGGVVLSDFDEDGRMDILFVAVDDPHEDNHWRYVTGFSCDVIDEKFECDTWNSYIELDPSPGHGHSGGGADVYDIDGNGTMEVVFMALDSAKPNEFRYVTGTDCNANDSTLTCTWTYSQPHVPTKVGDCSDGAGLAIGDIDGDGSIEAMFMAVDNTNCAETFESDRNKFRYVTGTDCYLGPRSDGDGSMMKCTWSSDYKKIDIKLDEKTNGGGAAMGDVDWDGEQEIILMAVSEPGAEGSGRYNVAGSGEEDYFPFIVGNNCEVVSGHIECEWSKLISPPASPGKESQGGGASIFRLWKEEE